MLQFGMSSRHSHPISCRFPRNERAAVVAFARVQGFSLSGLLKTAVRIYMGSETAVHPGVHKGHSPEPPEVYLAGMFPRRQPAGPISPPKPEDRLEREGLCHDGPDTIR